MAVTLYHYTTPSGLLGILQEKAFWASDCRFLNDTSEFEYGKKIVIKEIERYKSEIQAAGAEAWTSLSFLVRDLGDKNTVALVASFTTKGDLLSQWRGYNNGRGYAIGINEDWLNQNAIKQNFSLFPVSYDEDTQHKSAKGAIEMLLTMLADANNEPGRAHFVVQSWWKHTLKIALAMKDRHFIEEHEYRLAYIGPFWPSGIKLRQGTSGLIPYLPCKFDMLSIDNAIFHPNNKGLEEIIVGPAFKKQQLAAVDAVLASHHMRFKISSSEIPYTAD